MAAKHYFCSPVVQPSDQGLPIFSINKCKKKTLFSSYQMLTVSHGPFNPRSQTQPTTKEGYRVWPIDCIANIAFVLKVGTFKYLTHSRCAVECCLHENYCRGIYVRWNLLNHYHYCMAPSLGPGIVRDIIHIGIGIRDSGGCSPPYILCSENNYY